MNKILAILIMISLALPVIAEGEQGVINENTNSIETVQPEVQQRIQQESENIDVIASQEPQSTPYKTPYSKKKLAKKFLIAMLCVAGCSLFLYGSLSLYNKLRDGFVSTSESSIEGDESLETSTDLTEAVKTFIDKTKWD